MTTATSDLPEFIIAGAMKCATNSLHDALASHPDVFMPRREMVFFGVDDLEHHPDYFLFQRSTWRWLHYERDFPALLEWYRTFYAEAGADQTKGESAPAYFSSRLAPARIAELIPGVKLIFMLRDPVERAYSHYWHAVSNGRATSSFETCIRAAPGMMISQSLYRDHIERFLRFFPRESMKFVLFEQLVQDFESTVAHVLAFLGVERPLDNREPALHHNQARLRRSLRLHVAWNQVRRSVRSRRHHGFLPHVEQGRTVWDRWLERLYERLNPASGRRPPLMNEESRRMLSDYFAQQNAGLGELIGIPVEEYWPSMRRR